MFGDRPGEDGASAVEYSLLIAGIAAVIVVAVLLFGGAVTNLFTDSCESVAAHTSPTTSCS